jgi:hypothetical protein
MTTLSNLLAASAATPSFREAVLAFLSGGHAGEAIIFSPAAPRIKVERTLAMILKAYPELAIVSVSIDARSGCEYFRGEAVIRTAHEERWIEFDWDCRWKALQLGWTDYFGFPDQTRAAREFGFDCFRGWRDLRVRLLT